MRNFTIVACVVLFAVIGLCFYLNWFHVSSVRGEKGESGVSLTFDKEKAKADVDAAKEKVKEGAKTAKEKLTGNEEIKGTLKAVDLEKKQVTIAQAGQADMTVDIATDTKIKIGDKEARLEDLRTGQEVTCTHKTKDGKHTCVSLTAKADAGGTARTDDQAANAVEVKGTIKGVDLYKKQVTLAVMNGQPDVMVEITKDTKIRIDGMEGKLEDLRPGQEAMCRHTVRTGKHLCLNLAVKTGL